MIYGQNDKTAVFFIDGALTNGETASGFVDTQDYDFAVIEVVSSTSNDTTNNFTTLTLSEGTATTGYTAIATFTGDDTTDGFAIPAADTANPQVVARLNVRLDKRERYLKLEAAVLTTQAVVAYAHLSHADETPTTVANLGIGVAQTG